MKTNKAKKKKVFGRRNSLPTKKKTPKRDGID